MSMSDCERCWNTPCTCGWDYRSWHIEAINSQIRMLQIVRDFRMSHPNSVKKLHPDDEKAFIDCINKRYSH